MAKTPENNGLVTPAPKMGVEYPADLPEHLKGTKGLGNENVGADDVSIPRLGLVQNNSPQRMKDDANYIPGIAEGDFFDTLTKKKLDTPLLWVDAHYRKVFTVAVDRKKDAAGGILAQFDIKEDAEKFAAAHPDTAKLEVVDTPIHAGILFTLDGTMIGPTLIYMPKTKSKVSRQINGELSKVPAARWSRVWRLSSVLERNKNNQAYYNFKAENDGWVPAEVAKMAQEFHDKVSNITIVVRELDTSDAEPTSENF